MDWKHWLKWRPWKRRVVEAGATTPAVPSDEHAALRELLFADEPLESVVRFVREQEASGGGVSSLWRRLADVAELVARREHSRAVEELRRLMDDEGHDARSCFQFWNFLRQLGEVPSPDVATRVLGLVVEDARHGALDILAAYWDGTARLMDAKGGFRIFTKPAPVMVDHMRRDLRVCEPLVAATRPASSPRAAPPVGSRGRVTVLTPAGLRVRDGEWEELRADALCGPVLQMADALRERLLRGVAAMGPPWEHGVLALPGPGGPDGEGGPLVH
ncbi:hypothetical protein JY651_02080 [Pyxidicoccus parkwayensis]|uniref:Uncharacterized protein n=1 Tax=Pyxidicoccus parkwayensis TaxID=2813578 RepID=A0ABX7NYB9_9BACT|nr:hypothetical protein [Pyxidicoccus parkwaysis]QSQ23795.1 hypothetical protein JY651_02080 [Pyxidicoccus parkwaysis]